MGIFDNPKGHEPFFFFPLQESVERTSAPASILPASEAPETVRTPETSRSW